MAQKITAQKRLLQIISFKFKHKNIIANSVIIWKRLFAQQRLSSLIAQKISQQELYFKDFPLAETVQLIISTSKIINYNYAK